jgi:hypothetical protein
MSPKIRASGGVETPNIRYKRGREPAVASAVG